MKKISTLIIIMICCLGCDTLFEDTSGSSGDNNDEAGVFDYITLQWAIYVKDKNTNNPITDATVEWDQINLGPGSIVYPKSGSTDSNGKVSVSITVKYTFTSINVNITRVYSSSGTYKAFTGSRVITPRENNPASTTFYLEHI